ncbi:MAG: hypothetical protein Q9220_001829 [cf. Caloplaca sp. 1 TL-2023]
MKDFKTESYEDKHSRENQSDHGSPESYETVQENGKRSTRVVKTLEPSSQPEQARSPVVTTPTPCTSWSSPTSRGTKRPRFDDENESNEDNKKKDHSLLIPLESLLQRIVSMMSSERTKEICNPQDIAISPKLLIHLLEQTTKRKKHTSRTSRRSRSVKDNLLTQFDSVLTSGQTPGLLPSTQDGEQATKILNDPAAKPKAEQAEPADEMYATMQDKLSILAGKFLEEVDKTLRERRDEFLDACLTIQEDFLKELSMETLTSMDTLRAMGRMLSKEIIHLIDVSNLSSDRITALEQHMLEERESYAAHSRTLQDRIQNRRRQIFPEQINELAAGLQDDSTDESPTLQVTIEDDESD